MCTKTFSSPRGTFFLVFNSNWKNSECFASKINSELFLLESKNGCTNVTYVHCTCHKNRSVSEKESRSSIRDHSYNT